MKIELIIPIEAMHGKLSQHANYYFRTINGRQFVQRCPKRNKQRSAAQIRSNQIFASRVRIVAQMQNEGVNLTKKQLWKIAKEVL